MKLRTKNFPLVLLVTIGLYGIGCSEKNTALDPVEKVENFLCGVSFCIQVMICHTRVKKLE